MLWHLMMADSYERCLMRVGLVYNQKLPACLQSPASNPSVGETACFKGGKVCTKS